MKRIVVIIVAIAIVVTGLFAKTKVDVQRTNKSLDVKWLRSNGFWMTVNNYGQHAIKEGAIQAGGYWTYQAADAQYIYGAGIWIGAKIDGVEHVTVGYDPSDGSSEFTPGEHGSNFIDAQWKVYLSTGADWPLAEKKSVLDSYAIFNDGNPNPTQGPAGNVHVPLNVEVAQTTYEWNYPSNNDIVFILYDITNKGTSTIQDMYLAVTCDPDIGGATDDLVGYDAAHDIGYAYDVDGHESWGHAGYIGYDFLESANGLTAFKIFSIDVAPATDLQRYNLMRGYNMAGTTPQAFDVDSGPADKRFMLCTGPVNLAPDATTRVVIAIFPGYELGDDSTTTVIGEDARTYYTLIGNSNSAQFIYDNNYLLPSAPKEPVATIRSMNKKVYLSWDTAAETFADPYYAVASDPLSPVYDPAYIEYDFAGYRVYRASTSAGPWNAIATIPMDSLKHYYEDTTVYNGITYYYKVVAFDAQVNEPATLESTGMTLSATPRTDATGYTNPGTGFTVLPPGYTDGSVVNGSNIAKITPIVVNPRLVTGHTYRILVEEGTTAEIFRYSIIDMTTGVTKADHFTAYNQSGAYAAATRYIKWYLTEPVDGIQYRIDGPANGEAPYTITVDGFENAPSTAGSFDITSQYYSGGTSWLRGVATGNDLQVTFIETATPNLFDVQIKDLDETARVGHDVILPFNAIGPAGDPRYSSPYVISHWTFFGNNFGRYFDGGIDNLMFLNGQYVVLQEAFASDIEFNGSEPSDDLEIYIDTDYSRYADPGDYTFTFNTGNVFAITITKESTGTGSTLSVMASASDLRVATNLVREDIVVRVDATDTPQFYYKNWSTGVLTPATGVVNLGGGNYSIANSAATPAVYLVNITGAAKYGDSILVHFEDAGVTMNCTINKGLALYKFGSKQLPVALDGDGYFTLVGEMVNYIAGAAPVDGSYSPGFSGMYIQGNATTIVDGDQLTFTVNKNMIEDGTSFITRRTGNVPKGGEYWTVNTNMLTRDAKANLNNVKVVPNPIYPINMWDISATTRKAEFTNLPADCDIYIYNVAGDLVRHLVHKTSESNDPNGTMEWDVRNKENQDIAPGIYVYVVKSGSEKKEGTFAVIR